ncbi:hypothetical protein EYF80_055711 [Liparis tanakae]|uniref:Uncharacterized protein n=1 Tax=Liparis tanakae TaxID=230148 RepID=A0A4Z2EZC8_9TELE|nr:hypothetical protein EYF80_055711 [Liparis tanakae]
MAAPLVAPWLTCVVFLAAAAERGGEPFLLSGCVPCARCFPEDGPSCPEGARIHPSSPRCYWLSEAASPWPEARAACRETRGGDLASAGDWLPPADRYLTGSALLSGVYARTRVQPLPRAPDIGQLPVEVSGRPARLKG